MLLMRNYQTNSHQRMALTVTMKLHLPGLVIQSGKHQKYYIVIYLIFTEDYAGLLNSNDASFPHD